MARKKRSYSRRPASSARATVLAFHASPELVAACEAEVQRQRAARPGATVHRADVLRALAHAALLPKDGEG